MSIAPFMEFVPHLLSSASLNDSSVGFLACLIGMAGGLYLTNRQQQLKAKKAKIERKDDRSRRE